MFEGFQSHIFISHFVYYVAVVCQISEKKISIDLNRDKVKYLFDMQADKSGLSFNIMLLSNITHFGSCLLSS